MRAEVTPHTFSLEPTGPFKLAGQNRHFGGWPTLPHDPGAIIMAFPLEGSEHATAVVIGEPDSGVIAGEVHGCPPSFCDLARRQALAALSLDVDASDWPKVGSRDPVIARLQAKYEYLRPTLFHSPYEAAAAFIIGHRISIKQTRALRIRIAGELGTTISIDGQRVHAFPSPSQLLQARSVPGVSPIKTERLHAVARAAQEGWLRRESLRAMAPDTALAKLQTLPGVGAFFSEAILYRGAGTVDTLTDDAILRHAVTHAYGLSREPDELMLAQLAEAWRPYRMWSAVLLHVWARSELGLPPRRARSGHAVLAPRGRVNDRPRP